MNFLNDFFDSVSSDIMSAVSDRWTFTRPRPQLRRLQPPLRATAHRPCYLY